MSILVKRLIIRFARAALAGGFAAMAGVTMLSSYDLQDLKLWLFRLAFAFFVGCVSGFVQAGDLYFRNKDDEAQKEPAN